MLKTPTTGKQTTLDWLQIGAVLGLMIIGVLAIYSATLVTETAVAPPWYRQRFFMQIVWGVIGTGSAALLCLVDYHVLARWSLVGYWGTILLLVAVLIPHIGTTHGWGARRWIDLGPAQLQPSEFAKISFIFAMAHFLSRPPDELREPAVFWKALGMIGLPFALIMKEPDLGSALIFPAMGLLMLFAAGAPLRFLRRLVGGVGIVIALILVDIMFAPPNWQIKLEEYQRRRLLVYFGRDFAPRNAAPEEKARLRKEQRDHSYNVEQALISVGSGGLFGRGWFQGKQAALGYLPKAVAHNDFIFSVIAEEKGFMGSVVVITLYSVVLFTGLRTASQARDRLGKLLAVGVVAMLFSHVFINIGMNIRMMPVTGVPLPLLSYGGSSVLCSLIAIGIMQNVHLHRRAY